MDVQSLWSAGCNTLTLKCLTTHKSKNTTPILLLSEQAVTCIFKLMFRTKWERHTHRHTNTKTHKHIWSVVPLAVQKGQFFCQGNMLMANAVRGCHRDFCSLSTSHTVCHTLCYSLSKSMKCVQVFWVTVQKTQSGITWKQSKRKIDSKFWGFVRVERAQTEASRIGNHLKRMLDSWWMNPASNATFRLHIFHSGLPSGWNVV